MKKGPDPIFKLRDENIFEMYKKGEKKAEIARKFRISRERVGQIVDRIKSKKKKVK
jgi:Mor family transcriptional regulator